MNVVPMKMLITCAALSLAVSLYGQRTENTIRGIFDFELTQGNCYESLHELTAIGPRLSGSPGAEAAVKWGESIMKKYGFDSVFLQPVMVPHWVRGSSERARIIDTGRRTGNETDVAVCALGGSVGTGPKGVRAGIAEVLRIDDLARLGSNAIRGNIVFFNRPMDPKRIDTFSAYGEAVDQRVYGAAEAAKLGAVAVVVRSMASGIDDYAHTGVMLYDSGVQKSPAVAISTADAERLSAQLKKNPILELYIETNCATLPDVLSYNVVGELRGSSAPGEYIVVGGHLDAWDLGQGAHDDGAGCVHALEALRILKMTGYKPKHTVRAVLFMNEENGLRGGQKYAELANVHNERHLVAIESDRGGFVPRGFAMTGSTDFQDQVRSWTPMLEPYGLYDFDQPGGGADIEPLGETGVPVMELVPDSQRYFDFHHTSRDRFEYVNKRELELGSASMAAMVYLLDNLFP